MVTAEHSIVINRPVEDVFAVVADQANEPTWHTDVLEVHPAKSLEKGATVTWVVRFMGKRQRLIGPGRLAAGQQRGPGTSLRGLS